MSLWKDFANFCRRENEKDWRDSEQRENLRVAQWEAEQKVKKSKNSCANCAFFHEYSCGKLYWCSKLDFCYDLEDVKNNEVHHKNTCIHFSRK